MKSLSTVLKSATKILAFIPIFLISLQSANAQGSGGITIASIDHIDSKVLKEQRQIWVHLPSDDAGSKHPLKRYPVVYLLDAELYYEGVVGMLKLLGSNSVCPEMIVVGIPNTDRARDLTPTHVDGLYIDDKTSATTGGGEAFLTFIEKELAPHIDSLYATSPYRVLIGSSLGGLTVINAFTNHNNLFTGYIAIDPSLWWDKQRLLHETEQTLKTGSYANKSLFLGMAHSQPSGMDTATVQRDTTDGTLHMRSILQLNKDLVAARKNGLEAGFKYYDDETHGTVSLMTTYDALHFIFKDYQLRFQENYFTDPEFNFASFLTEHYKSISLKYGIAAVPGTVLLPPMKLVDDLGYELMDKKQFKKVKELFMMDIKNYPDSFDVWDFARRLVCANRQ